MYRDAKGPVGCATFVGPVRVQNVLGKDRGLFTTKAVKCGDLLACEKAFSYISTTSFGDLINLTTNRVKPGIYATHIPNVCQKLMKNPSLAPSCLNLCHSTYEPGPRKIKEGMPIIDR